MTSEQLRAMNLCLVGLVDDHIVAACWPPDQWHETAVEYLRNGYRVELRSFDPGASIFSPDDIAYSRRRLRTMRATDATDGR